MKLLLVETCGTPIPVDIPEIDVAHYLGGAPLTFCGTIMDLDVIVLIKEDSDDELNSYHIPGIKRFRGRALIIQTDTEGIPTDLDFEAYDNYVEWFNRPVSHNTRSKPYKT